MSHDRPQPDELLDAYLDGVLERDDRIAFERTLADRPDLAREVEKQREIDVSLGRALRVPDETELRKIVERSVAVRPRHAEPPHRARHRSPFAGRSVALAASIILLVTGAIMIRNASRSGGPSNPYGPLPKMSMVDVYDAEISAGFRPRVVCSDEEEFSLWFSNRFEQGLALDLPEGNTALGLGYSNTITPRSIHVLAETDGAQVILFIDRVDRDTEVASLPEGDLNRFRAEIGDLVVYEITPLPEPRFLSHFRVP